MTRESSGLVPTETEPLLSVVIPARDEVGNIGPLIQEVVETFATRSEMDYEIVVVDDGSLDGTLEILRELKTQVGCLRVICHFRQSGQSAAIVTGVRYAHAPWIATLDGDGQNDPADILKLWDLSQTYSLRGAGVLVTGRRQKRRDAFERRVLSWMLNRLSATMLKHPVMDKGCGLKVFRRQDFLALPSFDHMHRFLPALFGLLDADVISVTVNHRPRVSGQSHYGNISRLKEGLVDICVIRWLQCRAIQSGAEEKLSWMD